MNITIKTTKYPLLLVIALLIVCSGTSQSLPKATKKQQREYLRETKDFINYIKTVEQQDDTLLLADKPDMNEINGCTKMLFRDTALFTPEVQETILSQISAPLLTKWDTTLLQNVRIISSDTIQAIFKDRKKWWSYFYKQYGSGFNTYSAPIFFRDYNFCLFYSGHSCGGLCGGGHVILYKKEGGTWKQYRYYCDWIS